jgi:hypothetical protein
MHPGTISPSKLTTHFFLRYLLHLKKQQGFIMGTRLPQATALFAALLAVSFGAAAWKAVAAAPPPIVVGSIKCLDCFPNDISAEDAFKGTFYNNSKTNENSALCQAKFNWEVLPK